MNKTELKALIKAAINYQQDSYETLKLDSTGNPQVVALANLAKGKKDALSDVLSAIEGNSVYLKMLANK